MMDANSAMETLTGIVVEYKWWIAALLPFLLAVIVLKLRG